MEIEFHCTIHCINYGVTRNGKWPEDVCVECPLCTRKTYFALLEEFVQVRNQRDLLLECIDLKRTVRPLNTDNEEKANGGG